jgi:hypothetical protein
VNLLSLLTSVLAAVIGLAWLAMVMWIFDRQRRDTLPNSTPTAEERDAAAKELWTLYPAFPDDEPDTALFLLEESRRDYDGWVETNSRLEAKATWLTGFLAGGAGLLTVFASTQGDKAHIQPGPFLYLAIAAAFGALLASLYIVRPKLRSHPSASAYVSPLAAYASKSRFHLALSLAEEYNRASVTLAERRKFDPVAWAAAQGSLVLAVFAILIHFTMHLSDHQTAPNVVNCRVQSGSFHSGTAAKVSCEESQSAR